METDSLLVAGILPHLAPENDGQYLALLVVGGATVVILGIYYINRVYQKKKEKDSSTASEFLKVTEEFHKALLTVTESLVRITAAQESQTKIAEGLQKQISKQYDMVINNSVELGTIKGVLGGLEALHKKLRPKG
jgi:hypothetical protein